MATHLIHGFNVWDGGLDTVGRLTVYIKGKVILHDYGWTGLLGLACNNRSAVEKIIKAFEPGDSIIAHSNGCLIAWQAVELLGDNVKSVVCINPALRRDAVWHKGVDVMCLHNSTDWVVQLGRMWGRLFPFDGVEAQGWGAAGRYGFTSPHGKLSNWDTAMNYWKEPAKGHSGVFSVRCLPYWGGLVNQWLQAVSEPPSDSLQ
jgi:pimeloyl-ACP methyl ester carboxylesterase